MGVINFSSVWHIETVKPNSFNSCSQCTGLNMRFGSKHGDVLEPLRDIIHRQTTGKSHAIPLIESMNFKLVTGSLKSFTRELIGTALNFLHSQYVYIIA